MKTIITYILTFSFLIPALNASADKKNALFVGNSYTYYNNLPQLVADIATSLGDTLTHESSTPGGYTAQQHSTNTTTLGKIAQGGWDYVSIQCQSQEPSFSPGQVSTQTSPYVGILDSLIQSGSTCAETLMFMTWGRKNGDAQNCASYPPICTYNGMQQRLRESYLLFANDFNTSVSPVGAAWKKMRDTYPNIDLYTSDESHPSINGSYLAACVFYCTMYKKSCVGSQYLPAGVGNGDAYSMQQIASSVVLDSIENWHINGSIPDANFTNTPNANVINFTNISKRYANSSWNFGDGSALNTYPNPTHTYTFSGTSNSYTVCLEVTTACGKKDSSCQTILVNNGVGTNDFSITDKINIAQTKNQVIISNEFGNCDFSIINMNGSVVYNSTLSKGKTSIGMNSLVKGIYIMKVIKGNQMLLLQKLYNY